MVIEVETFTIIDNRANGGTYTHHGYRIQRGYALIHMNNGFESMEVVKRLINKKTVVDWIKDFYPSLFVEIQMHSGLILENEWIDYRPLGEEEDEEE